MESNEEVIPSITITSANNFTISKQSAESFHAAVRARILETGNGLLEYVEALKFFEKVLKEFTGDSGSDDPVKKEGDKELKGVLIGELLKNGGKLTSAKGTKFAIMEAGTKYHYENCGDTVLNEAMSTYEELGRKIKIRQDFLKKISVEGTTLVIEETGEAIKVYPPYKTSVSTFKVTLPK